MGQGIEKVIELAGQTIQLQENELNRAAQIIHELQARVAELEKAANESASANDDPALIPATDDTAPLNGEQLSKAR